jgi:ComF family protein
MAIAIHTGFLTSQAFALAGRFRDFLVPATCLSCGAIVGRDGGFCAGCWPGVRFIARPFCEILGRPFDYEPGEGTVSMEAIADPPPFDRHRCVMSYGNAARRLVSGLKFSDRTDLAPWMADLMTSFGAELLRDCDLIVPVPLHPRRLLQRRFNQSAELARRVAARSGKPCQMLALKRVKATRRQVGLGRPERARNVQGAFRVPATGGPHIQGRRVLLIDDVYTTGATIKACARALRRAGAAGVDALTFAMAGLDDI